MREEAAEEIKRGRQVRQKKDQAPPNDKGKKDGFPW